MGKQVPLTMYKGGVRYEIGMVTVAEDGSFAGQVKKDSWSLVKNLFAPGIGEFSINPVPPKLPDLKYQEVTHPKI